MIFYKSKKNRRVVVVVVIVVVVSALRVVLTKGVRGQKEQIAKEREGGGMKRVRLGSSFSLDRAQ